MINVRYHIFSLVAVFLALAIGLAAGSTVVRESLVNSLEDNQERLENRLDDLQAENDRLQGRVDELEERQSDLREEGPASLLANHLTGVPVLVVTVEGVEGDRVDDLDRALAAAGADAMGHLRLRRALLADEAAPFLAELLGVEGDPAELRTALVERLAELLAAEIEAGPRPPAATTTTTVTTTPPATEETGPPGATVADGADPGTDTVAPAPEDTAPPAGGDVEPDTAAPDDSVVAPSEEHGELVRLLDRLEDEGLVQVEGALGDPAVDLRYGTRLVVVGGRPDDEGRDATEVARALVDALAGRERVAIVVTDVATGDPEDEPAPLVAQVRRDGFLRDEVSTVDGLESFSGLAAVVLALDDLAFGAVGHYGQEEGAEALLPPGA